MRFARLTLAGVLCAPMALHAQTYTLRSQDVLPSQSYDFQLPSGEVLGNPARMEEYRAIAEDIARKSTDMVMKDLRERGMEMGVLPEGQTPAEALSASPGIAKLPDGYRVTILVSSSMGEGALQDLIGKYRGRKDVRLAFRGVPDGMSVPEFALWLQELLSADGEAITDLNININLDPELFDIASAELAPTMILEDLNAEGITPGKDAGRVVARAVGFSDADWLHERMIAGSTDERGPNAVAIVEEDLRVRAEREASAVMSRMTRDPEVLRKRYWDRLQADLQRNPIVPASVDRIRTLHFMFRTEAPIKDHAGKVIAHAGEVFQPKDVQAFDRRILVFNPNDPSEVAFVETALSQPREGVNRTMLIVSQIPRTATGAEPWQGIQELVDRFGMHVFVLNDHFRSSFKIEVTPTEIHPAVINGAVEVISQEMALK